LHELLREEVDMTKREPSRGDVVTKCCGRIVHVYLVHMETIAKRNARLSPSDQRLIEDGSMVMSGTWQCRVNPMHHSMWEVTIL
jgi:hypothetical protein